MSRVRHNVKGDDDHIQIMKRQPKTIWHPLSLQHLRPTQFVDVVNRILDG